MTLTHTYFKIYILLKNMIKIYISFKYGFEILVLFKNRFKTSILILFKNRFEILNILSIVVDSRWSQYFTNFAKKFPFDPPFNAACGDLCRNVGQIIWLISCLGNSQVTASKLPKLPY